MSFNDTGILPSAAEVNYIPSGRVLCKKGLVLRFSSTCRIGMSIAAYVLPRRHEIGAILSRNVL